MSGADAAVLRGLHPYQIVGPAWSLSLELQFYLLAPFLMLAKTATIVLLRVVSVAIRTALLFTGYPFEPYDYYGLPAELCLFLLGIISYRLLWAWGEQKPTAWGWRATIAMCALLIFLLLA